MRHQPFSLSMALALGASLLLPAAGFAAVNQSHQNAREFRNEVLSRKEQKENVFAWLHRGVGSGGSGPCPMGSGLGDGCPGHGGTFTLANCFTGYLQNSATWPSSRGPNWVNGRVIWNAPACDYGIGTTVSKATMLANPAVYDPLYQDTNGNYVNLPNCYIDDAVHTFGYSYWPWGLNTALKMHIVYCPGSGGIVDIKNLYMGSWPSYVSNGVTVPAHTAVGIYTLTANLTDIKFTNVMFDLDASSITNNQVSLSATGKPITSVYIGGNGNQTANITFTDVTVTGNYEDGSGCCDASVPNQAMFYINTHGKITFSYTALTNYVSYFGSFGLSNTAPGSVRGSIQWDHSLIDGCTLRSPAGHTECFSSALAIETRTEAYNVWHVRAGSVQQQTFCHCNAIGNQTLGNPNKDMDIHHNLYLVNPLGPAANNQQIQFHLDHGIMVFDAPPPSGVQKGAIVNGLALTLYNQVGVDANGWPKYQTDCGGSQSPMPWCPAVQKSLSQTFTASITNNVMEVTDFVGTITTNATVTAWTDNGSAGVTTLTAGTKITGFVSSPTGNSGSIGVYTVNNSQTVSQEYMTVSLGAGGLVRVLASISGNQLTITNLYNLIPEGGFLAGTGPLGGSVIGSQIDGDSGGLGHYNVSVPVDPSNPVQNMASTTGLSVDSGVYLNKTHYPYSVTKFINTNGMSNVFDLYYIPMEGTFNMHDNVFDTTGFFPSAGSGIASPSFCWTPTTTPTGNYSQLWVNNYDLNTSNTANVGGLVTTYDFSHSPGSGC